MNGNGFAQVFGIMSFDKSVVSHDKLGSGDHSSVDQDSLFERILSTLGTESCWLYTFSYSIHSIFILVFFKQMKNVQK